MLDLPCLGFLLFYTSLVHEAGPWSRIQSLHPHSGTCQQLHLWWSSFGLIQRFGVSSYLDESPLLAIAYTKLVPCPRSDPYKFGVRTIVQADFTWCEKQSNLFFLMKSIPIYRVVGRETSCGMVQNSGILQYIVLDLLFQDTLVLCRRHQWFFPWCSSLAKLTCTLQLIILEVLFRLIIDPRT